MKTPEELGIDACQYRNLARLAVGVRGYGGPVEFKMSPGWAAHYADPRGEAHVIVHAGNFAPFVGSCHTSACLAGHGPLLGIAARPLEPWDRYVKRVFGVESRGHFPWSHLFMFSPSWPDDRELACHRVGLYLQGGVPDWFPEAYRYGGPMIPRIVGEEVDWPAIEAIAAG